MTRCVGKISQKPSLHCQLRCFGYTQHSVVSFLWWVRELKSPTTAPSREPETLCTGPDSLSPEVALRNLPACNFQQFCNWLSYKMGFLQKQLAVPSLGIHFSIYAQNWVLKKKIPVVVRPQPNTALAFDMAMSHCRPLLILRSMYMGYFHMTCCRVKSSSTLHLCDDASSSKCILPVCV